MSVDSSFNPNPETILPAGQSPQPSVLHPSQTITIQLTPKVTINREDGTVLLSNVDVCEYSAAFDEAAYNPHVTDNPIKLDNRFTYWGPRLQAWIEKRYGAKLELAEIFWLTSRMNMLFLEAKKKFASELR